MTLVKTFLNLRYLGLAVFLFASIQAKSQPISPLSGRTDSISGGVGAVG